MRIHAWLSETLGYARASRTPTDFVRLMRIRLSESRVGAVITPRPLLTWVGLKPMDGHVTLRSHTSDICVLSELLGVNHYEHLPRNTPTVRTVVDLGANIGLVGRWLQHRYPTARLVCVEPDPGNLAIARANLSADVNLIAACIGGSERRTALATDHGEFAYHMTDPEPGTEGTVDVYTMSHVIDMAGIPGTIDVLKCDIEGAEREVFADCAEWIGRVRWLVAECHDPYTASDLEADLQRNGSDLRRVHHDRNDRDGCETITLAV